MARLRRTGSAYGYHNQTLEDEDGRELARLRADNARLRALVEAGIRRALDRISEEQIAAALAALADPSETTRQEAARSMLADMRGEYEG